MLLLRFAFKAPLLEQVIDAGRFPIADRVGTAAAIVYGGLWDPHHAFEFGLERVLDGIGVVIEAGTTAGRAS